ncbi:MAG: peptidoglycan bridge formation glycyltransferase FemA/FemB family protein [Candidatus Dormibacteraeota bacterium]|nr:peptidoglycan bridge formation glycyltransferase FemA/FemB family protein [Candidatus Dormibacteraeota bacterium]MBV9525964.1 peptidoglycan bridge formation glycyltransferase FemA/FemB family protein [Candidatus Dormibacteraeota bacterium]
MRTASPAELARWDELVLANPDGGHILQTRAWGEFKRRHGWTPLYVVADDGGHELAMLVLRRRALAAGGELWYLPKGPGVVDAAQLAAAIRQLRTAGSRVFGVKVEPEIGDSPVTVDALRQMGLRKSRRDVQITRATIIVDLAPDEDAILASFKPKTRYNIRLAARRGVSVEPAPATDANVDAMYELMAATRDRANFTLRPKDYFRGYWQLQEAAGQGQLFFARWEGTVLAGIYVTYLGAKGWYKDGGSMKEHAEVMAPHLLQWEVMRWLRQRGVRAYDLVAVPPRSELHEGHPLYGLYRFKSGFNEDITEFVGTWDLVRDARRFALWDRVVERALRSWTLRRHHDLLY